MCRLYEATWSSPEVVVTVGLQTSPMIKYAVSPTWKPGARRCGPWSGVLLGIYASHDVSYGLAQLRCNRRGDSRSWRECYLRLGTPKNAYLQRHS